MLNGVPSMVVGVIVLPSGLVTAPVAIMCRVKIDSPAVFRIPQANDGTRQVITVVGQLPDPARHSRSCK